MQKVLDGLAGDILGRGLCIDELRAQLHREDAGKDLQTTRVGNSSTTLFLATLSQHDR